MKKNYSLLVLVLIVGILILIPLTQRPQVNNPSVALSDFSTKRALNHIEKISKHPHYVGSKNHEVVANYLETTLEKLGLETKIQEGTTLSDWGNLVKSKNIMARIPGTSNSKALLLLTHYDSAPHSFSHGASDAGSGVGTILEGVRAFLNAKTAHKNDIILLFSDAEELGLNGAALFVTQHNWAKEIGLVLNFEARGTEGPSYMLMEVNQGNSALVKGFSAANVTFPVSNSLLYSIYKMLPNDTDLTVFREQGKIQGFNFAFIDHHFNYHTAQDDFAHISPKTIAHQGAYLMPLMTYFSNADLTKLDSKEDYVYFNLPFSFMSYPFSWVLPMVWIAGFLLFFLVFLGLGKRILNGKTLLIGFLPLFGAILLAGFCGFFGWKILLKIYPNYADIQQGFTYNGHAYVGAFVSLSLAICFSFYSKYKPDNRIVNVSIAPLFLWFLLNLGIALSLPGAGFFIIPLLFSLIILGYFVVTQKTSSIVNLLLSIPALLLFAPFIIMFPIGLGLKLLVASSILTVLLFGLMIPVLGWLPKKRNWALGFFMISIGLFVYAHLHADYVPGKAKPNSLLYLYDADSNEAKWTTYDSNLDEWTKKYLGETPVAADSLNKNPLYSKYHSGFTFMASAPIIDLSQPDIEFLQDSLGEKLRFIKIRITPKRKVNRYDIFANSQMNFYNLKANGAKSLTQNGALYPRNGKKIVSYYVINNEPLELQFSIYAATKFDMSLLESSFDLLTNSDLKIAKRAAWMIPMPFVLNDAVVLQKRIIPKTIEVINRTNSPGFVSQKDTLITTIDSLNSNKNP